jgi:hypothetical protein
LYGLPTFGTQCGIHTLRNGLQIRPIQQAIGKEVPEYGVCTYHAMLIKGKRTDGSGDRGKLCAVTDLPRYAATILWCPSIIPPIPTVALPRSPITTKVDGHDSLRLKQRFEDDFCGFHKCGKVRLSTGKLLLEICLEGFWIRGIRGKDNIGNNVAGWRYLFGHSGTSRCAHGTDKRGQGKGGKSRMLACDQALCLWGDLQRKIASSIRNGAGAALLSVRLCHKATKRLRDGRRWSAIIDNALKGHGCRHSRRTTIARFITPTAPTTPTPGNTEAQEETKYLPHQCFPRGHCRHPTLPPHAIPERSPY